jgi:hypothetical protein
MDNHVNKITRKTPKLVDDVTNMRINNSKHCIKSLPKWNKVVEKAKTSLKLWRLKKKKIMKIHLNKAF